MVEFKLPDIGEGMHEGEIVKWLVKEGDAVERDEPVVVIQTDKVTAELPAPATGRLAKIFFSEGQTAAVGAVLFSIADAGGVPSRQEIPQQSDVASDVSTRQVAQQSDSSLSLGLQRVLATPHIRRRARELGIDIEQVQGTGPIGRVMESDLEQFLAPREDNRSIVGHRLETIHEQSVNASTQPVAAQSAKTTAFAGHREVRLPITGMRKKIAEHMVKSVSRIPHVTQVDDIEMDGLKSLRDELLSYAEEKKVKLTFLPFFVKAVAIALREFPMLNATIDEQANEIVQKNYYHIGIATDTEAGLIVPVIKHVDRKSIFEIADEISTLANQARAGKLTLDQISGGTFTISNMGAVGSLSATPIINYPEVAILALHKMEPRMVVRENQGVIRLMMNMSLSFDHRIIDGVMAVRFTNRIKELLTNPKFLFMELR